MKTMSNIFERHATFKKGKKLSDFKKGEIIYVQKLIGGFDVSIECKFIKYERGKITLKMIRYSNEWMRLEWKYPDGIITAKPCKCYLWGLRTEHRMSDHDYCCHWCENGVFV